MSVALARTVLQRRLASSLRAIRRSLEGRRDRFAGAAGRAPGGCRVARSRRTIGQGTGRGHPLGCQAGRRGNSLPVREPRWRVSQRSLMTSSLPKPAARMADDWIKRLVVQGRTADTGGAPGLSAKAGAELARVGDRGIQLAAGFWQLSKWRIRGVRDTGRGARGAQVSEWRVSAMGTEAAIARRDFVRPFVN
jgi:hypothetical protein